MYHPVILCGGSGTRLWPASRPDRPKQFLPLIGPRSSFQQTLLRLKEAVPQAMPMVVTGESMAALVEEQARQIDCPVRLVVEPQARESGPAIAAAAALVAESDPEGIVLMLASDHHVGETDLFAEALANAWPMAKGGHIVTFGIRPRAAATGYGYIKAGEALESGGFAVAAFVEKPDAATAQRYVAEGYFWNSGNFAFRADVMLAELARFEPALLEGAAGSVTAARRQAGRVLLDASAFGRATRKSIDFAVMERTRKAAVCPARFSWSDLGAWDSILANSLQDDQGNSVQGMAVLIDCERVLVRSDGPTVGVVGLEDIAVVVDGGQILVCRLSEAQKVKQVAEAARKAAETAL